MSKKTVQVSGFPFFVTSQVAKDFIENYTGTGSIYALKIRNSKGKGPNPRVFAIVQFTTPKGAEIISSCTSLKYGSSYLNVRNMERDIVPKPRVTMLSLDDTTLHFGCQVSREKFKVLWERGNVMVNFGFGLRKVEILLSHYDIDYKLEFGYDSIWQIQLRNPRSRLSKYLILQVIAAPRIYEKLQQSSGDVYADPDLNYFRDTPDDQWIRCTDFTTSSCIGQSSAICLELPNDCSLSGINSENFHYYTEDKGQFLLESSTTFSQASELVPIVGPPQGHELPYSILFKINCLVQNGCLAGPTLDAAFFRLVDPRNINSVHIECALEKLFHHSKECCYEPVKWLVEQYKKYNIQKYSSRSPAISLDDGLVYTRRVQVTPSKVYFCGPEINVSNRVLRNYGKLIDNFIRVSFVDEDWEKMRSTDLAPRATSKTEDKKHTAIYKRILSILKNGITIGEKKFEFLAFSSSQLRDNSAWMFASSDGISAASIRAWMGDFHEIRNVAKYAARLGQSFSSSTETLSVGTHEIELIPDVELVRDGQKYVFSDGIGKISSEFAHRVAKKCGVHGFTPSSFQIRYGGYKGVVAVNPDPTSVKKLSLRRSMLKYTSRNIKLDVLTWSKYQPCFLNRQIISLLSTLGVKDDVFEKKQKEAVEQLDMILTDPLKARDVLDVMSPGENVNVLKEMLSCGYKPDVEPYLSMMLQTFRALKLLELRKKTRIFVPNGRSLMGCMDETRTLEYGQVFVQVSRMGLKTSAECVGNDTCPRSFIVKGKVVVAKNPCLHPGDVRVLQAVDIPSLRHMVDCVVFPQKGHRPHPNECSGSDLDGDIYFVTWDSELIPPRQLEPMDYTPEPPVLLDHNVTIEEVQEYFTKYIVNDSLGIIANAHTVFADKEFRRAESDQCIKLARLFSIAVDFNKTGIPAVIPPSLQVREYPDFMEKPDKPTYESPRVIGKLFRAVKHIAPTTNHIKSFTKDIAKQTYDHDMEIVGFEDYIADAHYYKGEYDFKLANLMDYYGIKTEPEILGGTIMKMSKSFDIRRDVEAIGFAVRSLKKEARKWFDEKCSRLGPDEDDDVYAKASAWYHVTYHPEYCDGYNEGMDKDHFLSFPWCVYDKLIHIKRMSNVQKRIVQSLQLQ